MSLREWLILIGALIILGIVLDGVRRMWRARQDSLEISRGMGGDQIRNSPLDDDFNPELPNGGARIVQPGRDTRQDAPAQDEAEVPTLEPQAQLNPDPGTPAREPEPVTPAAPSVETPVRADRESPMTAPKAPDQAPEAPITRREPDVADPAPQDPASEREVREPDWAEPVLDDAPLDEPRLDESGYQEPALTADTDAWSDDSGFRADPDDRPIREYDEEDAPRERTDSPLAAITRKWPTIESKGRELLERLRGQDNAAEQAAVEAAVREARESDHGDDSGDREWRERPLAGANRPEAREVFVINVHTRGDARYQGADLMRLFEACGLEYGDMAIYHRHEEPDTRSPVQFSVANAVAPGTFKPEELPGLQTPAISFFMSLPGPSNSLQAFDFMLETANTVVRNLGGELKDEGRSVMTPQTIEHCRQRIREFERKSRFARV